MARTKLLVFVLSARDLRPGRRPARAAPVDRADRFAALPAVGPGRDDVPAGRHGHLLRPLRRRRVFLYLEDVVTTLTKHWRRCVGAIFMVFVLFFPRGVWGSSAWLRSSAARAMSAHAH